MNKKTIVSVLYKNKNKIFIGILGILIIFIGIYYIFFRITLEDIKTNSPKYIHDLYSRMSKAGFNFTEKQLSDNLIFIDKLYEDKIINIKDQYYYYPESGQEFSYREQYLINFSN